VLLVERGHDVLHPLDVWNPLGVVEHDVEWVLPGRAILCVCQPDLDESALLVRLRPARKRVVGLLALDDLLLLLVRLKKVNLACVAMSENPVWRKFSRYIDIRH
jgi:hypothetical protein